MKWYYFFLQIWIHISYDVQIWGKGPYAMQSDQDILCLSTYTAISIDSLSRQWKALISLHKCAGWSGPSLSINCIRALFMHCTSYDSSHEMNMKWQVLFMLPTLKLEGLNDRVVGPILSVRPSVCHTFLVSKIAYWSWGVAYLFNIWKKKNGLSFVSVVTLYG